MPAAAGAAGAPPSIGEHEADGREAPVAAGAAGRPASLGEHGIAEEDAPVTVAVEDRPASLTETNRAGATLGGGCVPAGAGGPLQPLPEDATLRGRARHRAQRKKDTPAVRWTGPDPDAVSFDAEGGGQLGSIAAKVLMKILYGARMARFDLLRAVNHLACYITKWDAGCDRRLHRVVSYLDHTRNRHMVGWVGDGLDALSPHLFADADLAGCVDTQRSTSGMHMAVRGPCTNYPISAMSKRQGCVSHSTPEAEIVSMATAIRTTGLPSLPLWDAVFQRSTTLTVHEDNAAMICICESGKNPTMRYLSRTHGISVAWLHECFRRKELVLTHEDTKLMAADIYTKAFFDKDQWIAACWLINVVDPDDLQMLISLGDRPPPQGGDDPKKGTFAMNQDGSGVWTRMDYKAVRYRDVRLVGPRKHEVQKRVTTDVTTGEVLEVLENYALCTKRCEPLPEPTPRQIRTEFHFVHTDAKGARVGSLSRTGVAGADGSPIVERTSALHPVPVGVVGPGAPRPVFIEACCSSKSVFGQCQAMKDQYRHVRITRDDDFNSPHTLELVAKLLRGPGDVLWYSSPCTGGCPFLRYHLSRGNPETVRKIEEHWKLYRRLWKSFVSVARQAIGRGATVVIEWPKACSYWRDSRVQQFVQKHSLTGAVVDGCRVELRSVRADVAGMLVRKQWRLMTSNPELTRRLELRCAGDHEHIAVEGADCKRSENYTLMFVQHVMRAIAETTAPMIGGGEKMC